MKITVKYRASECSDCGEVHARDDLYAFNLSFPGKKPIKARICRDDFIELSADLDNIHHGVCGCGSPATDRITAKGFPPYSSGDSTVAIRAFSVAMCSSCAVKLHEDWRSLHWDGEVFDATKRPDKTERAGPVLVGHTRRPRS